MKKDKGSEFFYWNLSYRRKLIRTLWSFPIVLFCPPILYFDEVSGIKNILLSGAVFLIWILQLVYNYIRYQKEKKQQSKGKQE